MSSRHGANCVPIVQQHRVFCNSGAAASTGGRLDEGDAIVLCVQAIYRQVVVTCAMSRDNATGMADAQRRQIALWAEAAAFHVRA